MEFDLEEKWVEEADNQENGDLEEPASEEESVEKLCPPEVHMLFNSDVEVHDYYRRYGLQNGFGIMIKNTRKIEGVNTYLIVACHRYGYSVRKVVDSLNPKPIVKSNCKARLCAKRLVDDKWRVTQFDNDHNHSLSSSKVYRIRCNRKLTKHAKRSLNLCDEAGIPMNKSYNALVVEHGGHENMTFNKKDCENYMRTIRSIDLDDENRIKNLFWADARCREAYREFGDVVTFDTIYLTNKYDMPFAPFVGVNHHGQSILLGMSTTQRSESMNAFFDDYVNAKTSLREFLGQYDNALKDKVEKEVAADTRSLSTTIPCVTRHVLENQFQEVYTNDKFKEFQKEMINVMYCECALLQSDEAIFDYQVEEIQYVGDS
ncbi:hypothetical protein POM88_021938 [Heracleum sosnowskyi]|uniref:Protein FAR1-RELATED SEQUENCE n=1 Tax=Heracleum sosnowskyi TaxID=360622 RepID=A0AAD8IFJ4_9APIA|nr:hypothetical protein POM88_021938 [Heracleum sosnowskyi]